MSVTIKDVGHISKLAKLEFTEDEKIKLQGELNKILEYIDTLNELNLDTVEPLENINVTENVFREDEVKPGVTNDEALKNAPSKLETQAGSFFAVPKVVDK